MKESLPLLKLYSLAPSQTPQTRYQGSKYKLLDWIWDNISHLSFNTVLDAFGGSSCVSHYLKGQDKSVTYNDILKSNYLCGVALIENDSQTLNEEDIQFLISKHTDIEYDNLIARHFHDIYFTDDENLWLDIVSQNIPLLNDRFKQAIAYYALFQSAISKRPYNLFHRKNLYMRFAEVERGFGNKATWDKSFDSHFRDFVRRANDSVFDNGKKCEALNLDVNDVAGMYDLVYLDPPYMNDKGVSVDYYHFYHFLEGLSSYANWESQIDFKSKHRRLKPKRSPWNNAKEVTREFRAVLEHFKNSILVVSYRTDGIPSANNLVDMMREIKKNVTVRTLDGNYKYVLSTNSKSTEMLIIGCD